MPFYDQFGYIPQLAEPVSKCIFFIKKKFLKLLASLFTKYINVLQPMMTRRAPLIEQNCISTQYKEENTHLGSLGCLNRKVLE